MQNKLRCQALKYTYLNIFHCSNDKRPGLVSDRVARLYQQEAKHKQKNSENAVKPKKVLEAEKREEGLKSAISSDNKGFALLSKMGYKPGMSIGKKGINLRLLFIMSTVHSL